MESDSVDVLLLTYRNFISGIDFLDKIIERYNTCMKDSIDEEKKKIISLRVANIVKSWITNHFHDFTNDPNLGVKMLSLVTENFSNSVTDTLQILYKQKQIEYENRSKREFMFSESPPNSVFPMTNYFEDFDEIEFARQICLYEHELFRSIHPKECLNQAWNKSKEDAPHILNMIEFFNNFSRFVTTKICSFDNVRERANIIKKFLKILVECGKNYNFSTCQSIIAGFGSAPVHRLKISWKKVKDKRLIEKFEEFQEILGTDGSYSLLRKTLKSCNPPCIPYLGLYLSDLTFIEDGNPNYLIVEHNNGLVPNVINFEKMRKLASVIQDMILYQQIPYNFFKIDLIQQLIVKIHSGTLSLSEKENFDRSRSIETKEMIDEYFSNKNRSIFK